MPDTLYPETTLDFTLHELKTLKITTTKSYARIVVTANSVPNGYVDLDIYEKSSGYPSLTSYDNHSEKVGYTDDLTLYGFSAQDIYFGIYCWGIAGKGIVKIVGYTSESDAVEKPIGDVGDGVGDDIDNNGTVIDGTVGNVTVTINQDTAAIAQSIIDLKAALAETVTNSISGLSNSLNSTLSNINSKSLTDMSIISDGIKTAYGNSAILLGSDIDGLGDNISYGLYGIGNTIKSSITESGNQLYSRVGEPLLIAAKDIADNIKAISNNTIDDILTSVFEKVQG